MIKNRRTRGFWDWVYTGNWNGQDVNTGVGG
jgi:hypothetical protein